MSLNKLNLFISDNACTNESIADDPNNYVWSDDEDFMNISDDVSHETSLEDLETNFKESNPKKAKLMTPDS